MKSRNEIRSMHRAACRVMTVLLIVSPCASATESRERPADRKAVKHPLELAAPVLPAEVVDTMQEGRYDEAGRLLCRAWGKDEFNRRQGLLLLRRRDRPATGRPSRRRSRAPSQGRTSRPQRPLGHQDPIRAGWNRAELRETGRPRKSWPAPRPSGFSPATAKISSPGSTTNTPADLLDTGDPLIPADPNAAYDLLVQARELAESPPLRARLLFAMGKASMAAGNPARAIENFQLYVQEYPAGADQLTVRFQLGDAQQKSNQPLLARRTWTDLAREIERMPGRPAYRRNLRHPGRRALFHRLDVRNSQSSRRHQPEPGRRGAQSVSSRLIRPTPRPFAHRTSSPRRIWPEARAPRHSRHSRSS